MAELFRVTDGLSIRFREPADNPYSGSCRLHLRRVCGVCRHFAGDLRGQGRCALMGMGVAGRRDAGQCDHWERKTAGGTA